MKKILLIDGSSLIFRAFYAIKNLTTKDGVFVNGVYGFLNMYYKALELIKPTHIFVAFDKGSKTFRHNEFSDYKGTRDKAPNEITYQFGILKDLLSSMNVNYLELDEYEADDILGTVAKLAQKEGFEVDIFTGDRDYLQLVDENIFVHLTKKGISEIKLMNMDSVLEDYGLSPKQLIDVKALQGDSSDNIPGVKGVGEKTALKLIQEYGTLDNLYENLGNLKGKLKENLENAFEKVITTRDNDKYYSLDYRTKKANNENSDYFISIHLNSATNSSAKGCEVWLYNENIKLKNLANNLCNNLSTKMDTPNRGVKYSKNLSVLKNTKMPSLLIEIDFISNKEVENNLRNDNHLKNIADTISSTLLSFVNKSIVEDKVFYRVCIGSFSNKDNAVNLKNEAICKGFKDTHIYTT